MSAADKSSEIRILIVLLGAIGDLARGLSILKPIKQHYPRAHISWAVESKSLALLKAHPLVDKIYLFERPKGIPAFIKVVREIRQAKFDITLDLQRHFKSGILSFLSRAPRRIGFHRKNAKELNWIFNTEQTRYLANPAGKIEYYWEFLRNLGLEVPKQADFGMVDLQMSESAANILNEVKSSYITLILGSSWPSKDWLVEGYEQLIRLILSDTNYEVVLSGDKSQVNLAEELVRKVASGRVHSFAGKTSLVDALFVIRESEICIGPDSGPGHMAPLMETPYVSLFGPTSPRWSAPYNNEDLVVQAKLACVPCYRRECPGLDRLCMRLIAPEAVWTLAKSVLEEKAIQPSRGS